MITYTHQEAFDIIWEHAKKGERSMDERSCMYRGPCGARCFIGSLIPDERYFKEMDADILYCVEALKRAGITVAASPAEIFTLQRVHDSSTPEEWTALLVTYASDHGLTVPA
jgi:hypothetical protein